MMSLAEMRNDLELINAINWDILPEEAVGLHLEWGAGWAAHNYIVHGSKDTTYHFVVNTWEDPPVIFLFKRTSFDTEEIARIPLPDHLSRPFLKSAGYKKGNYAIEGDIKSWLRKELLEH